MSSAFATDKALHAAIVAAITTGEKIDVTPSSQDDSTTTTGVWADNKQTLRALIEANPRIRDHLAWWATHLRASMPADNDNAYFIVRDDHCATSDARYTGAYDGILFCWYIHTTEDLTSIEIPSEKDYELSKSDLDRLNSITDSLERSKVLLSLTNRRMMADCFWLSPLHMFARCNSARCKNAIYVSPQDNTIHISTAARGSNLTPGDVSNLLAGRIVRQDLAWNMGTAPRFNQINLFLPLKVILQIV